MLAITPTDHGKVGRKRDLYTVMKVGTRGGKICVFHLIDESSVLRRPLPKVHLELVSTSGKRSVELSACLLLGEVRRGASSLPAGLSSSKGIGPVMIPSKEVAIHIQTSCVKCSSEPGAT